MALWRVIGWGIVPVTGLVSLLLMGIEEIAVQIEEPFGVQPVDVMQSIAEADVID